MTMPKPTPEEQLFAVIQGAPQPPLRKRAIAVSWPGLRTQTVAFLTSLTLPRINQALAAFAILLGFLALVTPLIMPPRVERLLRSIHEPTAAHMRAPLEGLRPREEYLQMMAQHDPFRVGPEAGSSAASASSAPAAAAASAEVADLKLVGIAWDDEPTVMIEQHEQTFVLKVGQAIGQATVKEILKDRVILRVGNHDVELF